MAITNLSDAIDAYQADAAARFVAAQARLATPPDPKSPETAEDVKNRSQGQLAAAFSQLSTAATMRSAQAGRDGYADVVALMKTTSATATVICAQLKILAVTTNPTPIELRRMEVLTAALQALAQISPMPVWEKGWTPAGAAG